MKLSELFGKIAAGDDLEHLRRAGYNIDGWSKWQQGHCGTYACALIAKHPHLRFGVMGEEDEDGWHPTHYFAHDDHHAYDSAGKHPLPYHGINGDANYAELDSHPDDWGLPDEESGPEGPEPHLAEAVEHAERHQIVQGRYGPHARRTASVEDPGVYRGLSIVLPPHIHRMVHDPAQPHAARAHLLLSEIRKQKEGHTGEEATGQAGGLGSFWTPIRSKGEEYAQQSGGDAYREHEREHNCGDEDTGDEGCPTTRVVLHAHTPAEKHQWKEVFRPGERYDPEISWRLPIRPGTPMRVRSISWKEGKDNLPFSQKYGPEGDAKEKQPYEHYDFMADVRKQAGASEDEWPALSLEPGSEHVICRSVSRTAATDDEHTQQAMEEGAKSWFTTLHYDAENRWSDKVKKRRYTGHWDAQRHADEIADKEGVPRVRVGRNSHGSNWSWYSPSHSYNAGGPVIALGDDHLHEDKLIHEMAHHVHSLNGKPEDDDHGPGFTDRYIKMLRQHHSGGPQAAYGFIQSLQSTRHRMVHNHEWENSYTFGKPFPPLPESQKPYVPPPPPPDEIGDLHGGYTWRRPPDQPTGGAKRPLRAQIIAEHPDHGQVGRLTYFPPKRRNGIAKIDDVYVSPDHQRQGLASAMVDLVKQRHPESRIDFGRQRDLNDDGKAWLKGYNLREAGVSFGPGGERPKIGEDHYEEDDGYYKGLWDGWHPRLQPTIHRHMALDLPDDHPVHDSSLPMVARAHALLDHVSQGDSYRPQRLGYHWTDNPDYDHLSHGDRIRPGQTAAVIHAKTPPREHIEDNEHELTENRAVRDWDTDEREVPLKSNAPVHVTGVSWMSGGKPMHHTFSRPIEKLAAYVPPGTMGTDSEGHRVQMTTMDGWAHDDSSHGHDDNTTIGDKPVYTQDHTWLPNGRYWGPNSAQNDQRLFEGDHLRPEVREDILSRVDGFLRPRYKNWPRWTRVYFAGSEAARWAPFNGDMDVILGADFDKFRQENPEYSGQPDDAIAKTITDGMWHTINADGYWFTLADGRKVGPFDRTFFMSPSAWDIRNIKPYAAYNVTDDTWAVHPLQVPEDWDATHLPESYWTYAEAVLNEIKAIGQLPPEERHRMAANLWEELHTHRSDAFNGDGKGLFDLSNVIEKYLDQHPDKPWAQLVQWKSQSPSGPEPWVPTTARRTILSMLFGAKADEPEDDFHDTGIMVAFVPPKSVGKKLLVEGGEPLEALHVTLCYLGKTSEYSTAQMGELESLVRAWARTQKPLTATIGGAGTFYNPNEHVLMAHVDVPRGGGVRHSLSELLEEHGYNVRNDHGWTPHITLKYHKHPVRFLPKVEPASWDVGEIVLCVGGKWTPIALGE